MNEITDELNDIFEDEQQNTVMNAMMLPLSLIVLKKKDPKGIGYVSYARSKGINKNTFTFWVRKYLENKDRYCGAKTNKVVLSDNKILF